MDLIDLFDNIKVLFMYLWKYGRYMYSDIFFY